MQWLTGRKKGKDKNLNGYVENEESFLDEIKNIVQSFLRGYHLVENKNLIKK